MNPYSSQSGKRKPFRGHAARLVVIAAFVFVFGGIGAYALTQSFAYTGADTAAARLSLAPAVADMKRGDVINMAVNLTTNGPVASSATALIHYPQDQLKLNAVTDVCPKPDFSATTKQTTAEGSIALACDSTAGIKGQTTMAMLTFTAQTDGTSAPVTIEADKSEVKDTHNQTVAAATTDSTLALRTPEEAKAIAAQQQNTVKPLTLAQRCAIEPKGANCTPRKPGQPVHEVLSGATTGGITPAQFHATYKMPCSPGGAVQSVCPTPTTFGPNIIAEVDFGGYTGGAAGVESDMAIFDQKYGLPACTRANGCLTVTDASGGNALPPTDSTSTLETSMDIQAMHMMCQTCKIAVILTNNTASDISKGQQYAISLHPVSTSHSYSYDALNEASYKTPGVFNFAADGDYNGDLSTDPEYPAEFPGVVAVSGTTLKLNSDGTRASETVWNAGTDTGTGGGCSSSYAAPSWQTSLPNWSSAGCGTKRALGDISADADWNNSPGNYVAAGTWGLNGGTSQATPLLASMAALANPNGVPAGADTVAALYANYASDPSAFYDITSGNNCVSGTTHCTAGTGFDTPSGLGAPNGVRGLTVSSSGTATCSAAPTVPSGLASTNISSASVTIGWKASTPGAGCTLSGYHVYRNGNLLGTATAANLTYLDNGLATNTSYNYTVSAYDASGHESAQSAAFTVKTTGDTTPPSAPTNLRAGSVTSNTISLTWTASTDNILVTGYNIYRNGTQIGTSNTPSYTDTNLQPLTSFTYTVKAYDAGGNVSAASTALTTSTLDGPAPAKLIGDLNGDGKVNLIDLSTLLAHWTP